jgi:hypothetical protein
MTAAEGFRRDPAVTREHSSLENRTTVPLTVSQTSADESSCTHTSICSFFYYCKDKKEKKKKDQGHLWLPFQQSDSRIIAVGIT